MPSAWATSAIANDSSNCWAPSSRPKRIWVWRSITLNLYKAKYRKGLGGCQSKRGKERGGLKSSTPLSTPKRRLCLRLLLEVFQNYLHRLFQVLSRAELDDLRA